MKCLPNLQLCQTFLLDCLDERVQLEEELVQTGDQVQVRAERTPPGGLWSGEEDRRDAVLVPGVGAMRAGEDEVVLLSPSSTPVTGDSALQSPRLSHHRLGT